MVGVLPRARDAENDFGVEGQKILRTIMEFSTHGHEHECQDCTCVPVPLLSSPKLSLRR